MVGMDIPETNEWMLRHAANGLAGLKALRDLPTEDADAINYAYQQLLAAADQVGSDAKDAPQRTVRVWTGSEWIAVVNHGWDVSLWPAYDPEERVLRGDLRVFLQP